MNVIISDISQQQQQNSPILSTKWLKLCSLTEVVTWLNNTNLTHPEHEVVEALFVDGLQGPDEFEGEVHQQR